MMLLFFWFFFFAECFDSRDGVPNKTGTARSLNSCGEGVLLQEKWFIPI